MTLRTGGQSWVSVNTGLTNCFCLLQFNASLSFKTWEKKTSINASEIIKKTFQLHKLALEVFAINFEFTQRLRQPTFD